MFAVPFVFGVLNKRGRGGRERERDRERERERQRETPGAFLRKQENYRLTIHVKEPLSYTKDGFLAKNTEVLSKLFFLAECTARCFSKSIFRLVKIYFAHASSSVQTHSPLLCTLNQLSHFDQHEEKKEKVAENREKKERTKK